MIYPQLWGREVEERIKQEAYNADPQTVPEEVVMCSRCVMTNQRPRTKFYDGVCSACKYVEYARTIDWDQRELELKELLDEHRKEIGYDVVVPGSGGKDSSMVAHRLRDEYGMNPVIALAEPFMYTDIGRKNKDALANAGFDILSLKTDGIAHRRLARIALEYYGDPFMPFVYLQLCWPMHVASMLGVSLVFGGENGEAMYGGDTSSADKPCFPIHEWDRVYHKGTNIWRLYRHLEELGAEVGLSKFYNLPKLKPQYHWWSYYKFWHPMMSFYRAQEHTGFTPNEERSEGTYTKFASLDDKLDGLHYWFGFLKFGIGRCTSDAAQQVRFGDIERDEALALVERYDGEVPQKSQAECLDYLGMDQAHFESVVERFRAKVPADSAA